MAKRREDRYATAKEFADDLQRVLEGKPTVARPPSLLDRTARWAQRHREVVAVAGLIGVLALLGLTASTLLIAREQQKTAQNFALAEKRFREAQDTVENLGTRLSERLANVPGRPPRSGKTCSARPWVIIAALSIRPKTTPTCGPTWP